MYLDHFGLSRPPFKITPDTRLFYPGGSRGEILEAIVYAILDGEGIVKVVGEVGSGKTMLSRMLEIRLPDSVDIVYLANPSVAPGDVMHAITLEMGLALPSEASRLQALHLLQAELLSRHAKGRQVVCFVEEAQAMPIETLEEIRLLSNLETHQDKLLQIVLFGQPELDNNLDGPNIRQLRERIVHSFSLAPFGVNEIREYVHFRMQGAGYRGPDIFTTAAYRKMAKASLGLVRRINIIGDKALLAAYAVNSYQVGPRQVAVAVADSEFGRITHRRRGPGLAWAAGIGLLAVGLAVAGTAYVMQRPVATVIADATPTPREPAAKITTPVTLTGLDGAGGSEGEGVTPRVMSSSAPSDVHRAAMIANANRSSGAGALTAKADAPTQASESPRWASVNELKPGSVRPRDGGEIVAAPRGLLNPSAEPHGAGTVGIPTDPRGTVKVRAPADPSTFTDVTVSNLSPSQRTQRTTHVQATAPSSSGEPAGGVQARTAGFKAGTSEPTVVAVPLATADSEGVRPSRTLSMTREIQLQSAPVGVPASELATIQPGVLENRLDATRSWLSGAPGGNFSIQLMMTHGDNWQNLEQFLLRWRPEDLASVYVYQAKIRGRTWYGVLFNEYDSLKDAQKALTSLPEELKRHKPYVRKISRISPVG